MKVSCTSQSRPIIGFAYLNLLLSLLEKRRMDLEYNYINKSASVSCKCVKSSIIS